VSRSIVIFALLLWITAAFAADPAYKYFRSGNPNDVARKPQAGYALMGGGTDLDEAFTWMCKKADGGDFLVIRATGDDAYNPYVAGLCKLNSVATLVIPNSEAAHDPRVAEIIRQSEALFISGGDQSNYIKYWQNSPVQEAINDLIRRGIPIGGTSAGLAVMGQFIFSAMNDTAYSKETLADPYNKGVTIAHDFVQIPHLENLITDTHFVKRDRLGRFLGFMARIMADAIANTIRGIPIDEKVAVLMEPDGGMKVVGKGIAAYFMRPAHAAELCKAGQPLTFENIEVYKAPPGASFDVVKWQGTGGSGYVLNVNNGVVTSTQAGGSLY
jgi:cyanophycinase